MYTRACCARSCMVVRKPAYAVFGDDHVQEHDPDRACPACDGVDTGSSELVALKRMRPAAIRRLGVTGNVPVMTERMDAIQTPKTMAGSPDADLNQRPAILRMVFVFWGRTFFRELMKEDRNVQYSFCGDRLGWTSAQA